MNIEDYLLSMDSVERIYSTIGSSAARLAKQEIIKKINYQTNNFILIPIFNLENPDVVNRGLEAFTNHKLLRKNTAIICFLNGEKNNNCKPLREILDKHANICPKLIWFEHTWSNLELSRFCMAAVRRILVDFVIQICIYLYRDPYDIAIIQGDIDTHEICDQYIKKIRIVHDSYKSDFTNNYIYRTRHNYYSSGNQGLDTYIQLQQVYKNLRDYYYINLNQSATKAVFTKRPPNRWQYYTSSDRTSAYSLHTYILCGGFPITKMIICETAQLIQRMGKVQYIEVPATVHTNPRRHVQRIYKCESIKDNDSWKDWGNFGELDRSRTNRNQNNIQREEDGIYQRFLHQQKVLANRSRISQLSWLYSYGLHIICKKYPCFNSIFEPTTLEPYEFSIPIPKEYQS